MDKSGEGAQRRAEEATLTLVVRRTIRASAEKLFAAWTEPAQLKACWGPQGVRCIGAELDLRVGGSYRIGNQLPDGSVIWIAGEFELIERPRKLVFSWRLEGIESEPERVTVQFEAAGDATEVIVTHQRIASREVRERHEQGWIGCLESLDQYTNGG
jgi:uncharacterized protein YndB with AHSA1/START domain